MNSAHQTGPFIQPGAEGLGNPQEVAQAPQQPQSSGAEMFNPNVMLGQKNAQLTGAQQQREYELQNAAAEQGYAQAEQDRAKAAIMQNAQQQQQGMVMDAAQAIANGTPPEALLQQGAPKELVMAAVQMVQQQQGPKGLYPSGHQTGPFIRG